MAKPALPPFAGLLHLFFHEWLVEQRDASHRTILTYRDTWRLFLRFVAQRLKRRVSALRTEDFTERMLLDFLQHIERDRHGSVGTRNCREAMCRGVARSVQAGTAKSHVLSGTGGSSGDSCSAQPNFR
jgi:hypothetical protein